MTTAHTGRGLLPDSAKVQNAVTVTVTEVT